VRVLLGTDLSRIRLDCAAPILVHTGLAKTINRLPAGEATIAASDAGGRTQLGNRSFSEDLLVFRGENSAPLALSLERDGQWLPESIYPGVVNLRRLDGGLLEITNTVELDEYVGCVVANEVWPTFEIEAFRAQAIIARTFVLYQMTRRPDAAYDVYATQGSQVYRGLRDDPVGRKARDAAEYTRGLALTWNDGGEDRLFCAYYSAACGGSSQSAKLLGPEGDVGPLRGGVHCDYCKIAPGDTYRWGPVRLSLGDVAARLSARYPEVSALGRITAISPLEQAGGRIVSLRLTGSGGGTHDVLAERFRLAIDAGLIRSTDCRIRVAGDEVVFENGKGFGHGLGLCQWGMQGLALSGKQAAEILRFYYPGSKLTRVY
jgi:stage II sporulation protein D